MRKTWPNDKRRSPRTALRWDGVIVKLDGSVAGRCITQDVSDGGAKLLLEQEAPSDSEFLLILARGGKVRRKCRIVWQSNREVGIAFVGAKKVG